MFEAGTLRMKLVERTASARASGHLESIPTDLLEVEKHGVRWAIRSAPGLVQKKRAATTPARNPFLPYEPEMFVADATPSHAILLNKFNVVDHHLLIVTRDFDHQRTLLTEADFEAMHRCLDEMDGLAFYNGGPAAGASQPHKHLQLVPMEPAIAPLMVGLVDGCVERLPFLHAATPDRSWHAYLRLIRVLDRSSSVGPARDAELAEPTPDGPGVRAPFAYNLLVTRQWMLMVPRSAESLDSIQVNALGYAGSFLVLDEAARRRVAADPLQILLGVGVPA